MCISLVYMYNYVTMHGAKNTKKVYSCSDIPKVASASWFKTATLW